MMVINVTMMFSRMNRIFRTALCTEFLKGSNPMLSRSVGNLSKVKVVFEKDDMKISFRYLNRMHEISGTKRQESVKTVLSKIKGIAATRRHHVLQQIKMGQFSVIDENFYGDDLKTEAEVCLMRGDEFVESSVPNSDAWTNGSFLKIGSFLYEVHHNNRTVKSLTLPNIILAECFIRPHLEVDHRPDGYEGRFIWYHSVSQEEAELYKNGETEDVMKVKEKWWVKVHEGMMYWTSRNDVGRKLRVIFIPKWSETEGDVYAAESSNAVCSGPENFPFQERHLYTQELTSSNSIRCLTYNILANMYVERKRFPYCSEVARDNYYRRQILTKELLGYNGDILCLQEVQGRMFEVDLLPVLQDAGFDGFYTRKIGQRHEGLACFYRASRFRVINEEGVPLSKIIEDKNIFSELLLKLSGNFKDVAKLLRQYSVLQVVLLEHADNPKRRILVANTHLYSNKNAPEVRFLQSVLCVGYIEHLLKTQDADNSTAVLFCGDFNSLPDSAVLKFLLQGSSECSPSWHKNESESSVDSTVKHCLTLDSACGFPTYTNYTEEFNGCLDYIFYSTDFLSVDEIVPLPSHESVTQHVGLPSELFPSDHIPLICTLKWK